MRPQKRKQGKYAKNEADHELSTITDYPVVNDRRYFKIFEYGENILKKIDATCK